MVLGGAEALGWGTRRQRTECTIVPDEVSGGNKNMVASGVSRGCILNPVRPAKSSY